VPTTLLTRGGPRAVAAAAARPPAADEGIVTAIVSVTGTEDSVRDIVHPGAFAATLRRRRPKFCWMHDWKRPLGSVLSIVELKPGDKRLPKRTPDGRPWPAAAGALIATMKFNLKTQDGRDFYEHCKLWAATGEAAFSIGYKVLDGQSSKRGDVRIIYGLELYECSLVLHGAHDMALALEVKGADASDSSPIPDLEHKDTDGIGLVDEAPVQPDHTDGVMVALYPDPESAARIAVPGGLEPDDLHVTIAYLGTDPVDDPTALASAIGAAVADVGPLEGSVGGIGRFPAGPDGEPVWVPVDVPGLDRLRVAVTGALADAGRPQQSEHGFTPHMTLGYGLDDVDVVPPTPLSFSDAYLVVGTNRYPIPLAPAAPAASPMEGKAVVLELARLMRRDGLAAVMEAKSLPKTQKCAQCSSPATKRIVHTEGRAYAPACDDHEGDIKKDLGDWVVDTRPIEGKSIPTPTTEKKSMPYMPGSYEERRDLVQKAVNDLLMPPLEDPDAPRGWVCVDAMFDDYVIVTRTGARDDETFRLGYRLDGDAVSLDQPEPVQLSLIALDEPDELTEGADVRIRFLDPAAGALEDAVRFVGALPEGKSLGELTDPLLRLLDQLAVKGYDVAGAVMGEVAPDEEDEPESDDEEYGDYPDPEDEPTEDEPVEPEPDGDADDEVVPTADAPVAPVEPEPTPEDARTADPDADDDEDEVVHLDPDEHRAQMDALRA
jgi:2'-5' RNA ligase